MSVAEYKRLMASEQPADGSMSDADFQSALRSSQLEAAKKLPILINRNQKKVFDKAGIDTSKMVLNKPMSSGMPQPTEHEIQNTILERLRFINKGFFWRENSGLMKLESKGKDRFFRAGTPGIPDIMGVYEGFSIGIEVKRPGKKQSLDQKAFQNRFDQCGGIYLVCTDATQIVSQIMAAITMKKGE